MNSKLHGRTAAGVDNKINLSQRHFIAISQWPRSTRALQQRALYRGIVSLPVIDSIPLDAIIRFEVKGTTIIEPILGSRPCHR